MCNVLADACTLLRKIIECICSKRLQFDCCESWCTQHPSGIFHLKSDNTLTTFKLQTITTTAHFFIQQPKPQNQKNTCRMSEQSHQSDNVLRLVVLGPSGVGMFVRVACVRVACVRTCVHACMVCVNVCARDKTERICCIDLLFFV